MNTGGNPKADLERDGPVPALYLQVAQRLRQDIMDGRWQTGHMLPSEGALAASYQVSKSTVRLALAMLRREGMIVTRRGAGTQVRAVPNRITVEIRADDEVSTRMPTPEERRALDLPEGVWVLSIRRPGREEELYAGHRARLKVSAG